MAQCLSPYNVKVVGEQYTIAVPCGKCLDCKAARVSGWSFRLMQEDKVSSTSAFVTLTYDTSHVPITQRGYMTVRKVDVQLFFKRLRKAQPLPRIKYFLAAEYGGKTNRPHYHIIIFNVVDPLSIPKAWKLGNTDHGTVSGASIGYTLKYINKPKRIPMHANDDRQPEFQLMSKGLGASYLSDAIKNYHLSDVTGKCFLTLEGGKKARMPRYYKDKIYNEEQRESIASDGLKKATESHRQLLTELDKRGVNYEDYRSMLVTDKLRKQKTIATKNDKL